MNKNISQNKLFFEKITLNNYKNINNEITIDFMSATSTKVSTTPYIKPLEGKILNKISLLGKNGIGKTNLLDGILLISKINDFCKEKDIDNNIEINKEIENIYFNLHIKGDIFDVNYIWENQRESIEFYRNSNVNNKKFRISSDYLNEVFKTKNISFSTVNKRDIDNYIYLKKQDPNSILNEQDLSLLILFGFNINSRTKKINNKILFSDKEFEQSLLRDIFKLFNSIHKLDMKNGYFTGSAITEIDLNKTNILKHLYNNNEELQEIEYILNDLDYDINNLKLIKDEHEYKLTFTEKDLDFFSCGSSGSKKLFGILSFLSYWKDDKTKSLILFDELDAMLNTFIIEKILKHSFWEKHQLIFTYHNTNILSKNFNIFKPEQITFMRYSNYKKEIVTLFDFNDYNKYIRNNKLTGHILDNIFETEPII